MKDMSKHMDQSVRVKFMGGREVVGVLKGYDALLNLVLDDTQEFLKDHSRRGLRIITMKQETPAGAAL